MGQRRVGRHAIDARAGNTFAKVLRTFLRQDPDVMMIGEIRDLETAEIAVQAALTGHFVFSTRAVTRGAEAPRPNARSESTSWQ